MLGRWEPSIRINPCFRNTPSICILNTQRTCQKLSHKTVGFQSLTYSLEYGEATCPNLLFPVCCCPRSHKHGVPRDDESRKCKVMKHKTKTKMISQALWLCIVGLVFYLSWYFVELWCRCKSNSKFFLCVFLSKIRNTLGEERWGDSMADNHKAVKAKSNCNAGFVIFVGENGGQPSSLPRIQKQKQHIMFTNKFF